MLEFISFKHVWSVFCCCMEHLVLKLGSQKSIFMMRIFAREWKRNEPCTLKQTHFFFAFFKFFMHRPKWERHKYIENKRLRPYCESNTFLPSESSTALIYRHDKLTNIKALETGSYIVAAFQLIFFKPYMASLLQQFLCLMYTICTGCFFFLMSKLRVISLTYLCGMCTSNG